MLGEEREVRLRGGTVRYRETGEGEPVVFVHGLLVHGGLWRGGCRGCRGAFAASCRTGRSGRRG